MSHGKLFLIVGIIGWAVLIALEMFGVTVTRGGDSIRWLLTSVFILGYLIRAITEGFDACAKAIAEGLKALDPVLESGFGHLSTTIQSIDLGPDFRDIAEFLPKQFRYIDCDVSFDVGVDGYITVTRKYTVKNIADREITSIPLPTYGFDVADHEGSEEELDEFLELEIDGKNVERHIDSIRVIRIIPGSIFPERPYSSRVEANYRIPVSLPSMRSVRIELRHRIPRSAREFNELEIFGVRILDITEKLTLAVRCDKEYQLKLMETAGYPHGAQVINTISQDMVNDEVRRMPIPERLSDEALYWKVDRPKIGYTYAIRVKTTKV